MNRFFLTLAAMLWAHVWCAAAPAPDGVRGTVRGGEGADAEPLVGAVVVWAGTSVAAVTDADGRFVIRRPAGAVRLVATYVGFVADTLAVAPMEAEAHFALRPVAMAEVTVGARRAGSSLDRLSALTTINVTSAELTRAACCNLGESFENNASVDVGYQDATTGARAIRMLGLGGQYVQMMTENVPNLRGLASTFGLSYVPGPWMDGISVSKGVGTVVNGYEAITGQIDVEYKKPMGEGTASGNVFASSAGRVEANADVRLHATPRLASMLMLAASTDTRTVDDNHDLFRDEPEARQLNLLTRWNFVSGRGYVMHAVARVLREERTGGHVDFTGTRPDSSVYGISIVSDRVEAWVKNGLVAAGSDASVGIIAACVWHRRRSAYGLRWHNGTQLSPMFNVIAERGMGRQRIHLGLGAQADISDDRADIGSGLTVDSRHTDCSAGVFGQYTLTLADRLTLVAGLRADAHNHRGLFVTPRLHLRFSPVGGTVVRIAAGRGSRTASVMAEHGHRLASSRQWRTGALFVHERAWNAGIGLTQYVDLWGRELTLTAEYYRTQFGRRLVPDFDSSARTLVFVADGSRSFSNTVQLEARWQPLRGLDLDVAWRLNDARQTTAGRLRSTPLQSRYKALLAASYATPLHKWQADVNVQLSGGGRIPTTHGNPEPYRRPARFGSFGVLNAQLTRFFRHCSVYAGAENIGSVMQHDPVVAADDPFGPYFDGTLVWGPLMGRRFYAGFRFEF